MRRFVCTALAALALTGAPQAEPDCNVTVEQPWAPAPAGFKAEATTLGPSCGKAAVVLILRDDQDFPLWIVTLTTMNLELLGVAEKPEDMRAALAAWIAPYEPEPQTAAALPDWPEDGEAPSSVAGLGFEIDPGLDRLDWQGFRNADAPLYCYSLEMTTRTCVALERVTNAITPIGRLVYPDTE